MCSPTEEWFAKLKDSKYLLFYIAAECYFTLCKFSWLISVNHYDSILNYTIAIGHHISDITKRTDLMLVAAYGEHRNGTPRVLIVVRSLHLMKLLTVLTRRMPITAHA